MSFQWTLVSGFLYGEIVLIILMLSAIIKPTFWRSFFQSRFMSMISAQSNLYLWAFVGVLCLFFAESVRELHKYSNKLHNSENRYTGSMAYFEDQMRMFRGQRNFYISGFAIFCIFIIKRLISFFGEFARLKAEATASLQQAKNAAELANKSLEKPSSSNINSQAGDDNTESLKNQNIKLKKMVDDLTKKLKTAELNLETVQKQAASTNKAFDEMAEKYSKLEAKQASLSRKDK